jgi:hypothetical protein
VFRDADEGPYPKARRCSTGWRDGGVAVLGAACIVLSTSAASAQCAARDVIRNHLTSRTATPSAGASPAPFEYAATAPVWRTITVGTFANSFALLNALDAAGCAVGDSAAQALARPAFTVSATKASVELVAVSVAELGFQADVVRLSDIYARARELGLALAAAEIAPQLRLQYLDQPLGEFLIAMEPIETWEGAPVILTVANFGAGLVILGRNGSPDAQIPVASRFLFARPNETASATTTHVPVETATLGRH